MRNVTGQVVRGEDFFDREHEQARFWRDLETDNLLLLAPRRVGKTSLMRRLGEAAHDKGFTVVFVDVSDAGGEAVFVGRLYQAVLETEASNPLWGQMEKSWLGKLFRRVKKVSGPGFSMEFHAGQAGDWSRLGRDLAEALSGLEGRWLLQIDELPVFILKLLNDSDAARERVREFLYWMRRLRLEFPWMLAGSSV
jgi:AAA+ ATPase superfamily predicted ATPase